MHSDSQPEAALQLLQLLQSFPITVRRENISLLHVAVQNQQIAAESLRRHPSLEVNTDHPCLLNGVQLLKSFCLGRSWIAYKSSRCSESQSLKPGGANSSPPCRCKIAAVVV